MDTKPVPVVGYKRNKRQSEFTGSADYGWCASRICFNGAVKYVQLPTNRETGRVRGFGFVEMETSTEEDAQINAILVKKNR